MPSVGIFRLAASALEGVGWPTASLSSLCGRCMCALTATIYAIVKIVSWVHVHLALRSSVCACGPGIDSNIWVNARHSHAHADGPAPRPFIFLEGAAPTRLCICTHTLLTLVSARRRRWMSV